MKEKEILEQVYNLISEIQTTLTPASLKEDMLIGEYGIEMDSLHYLQLLVQVEKRFRIKIEDEMWMYNNSLTIKELVDYIWDKLVKQQQITHPFQFLVDHAVKSPGKTALICQTGCLTYQELIQKIIQYQRYYRRIGIGRGDHVLLYMDNCFEFVISFFSLIIYGAVVVLADIKYGSREFYHVMDQTKCKWCFTMSPYAEKAASTFQDLCKVVLCEEITEEVSEKEVLNFGKFNLTDTALVQYTSGSLGIPKGTVHTLKTLQAMVVNHINTYPISGDDTFLGAPPFFHSYTLGSCMLPALATGARMIIVAAFGPRIILKIIEKYNVTVFFGVPYMYKLLNECSDLEEYNLSNIKLCISAGASLSNEISDDFYAKTGIIIRQEYGSAETGTMTVNLSEQVGKKMSIGKALANVHLYITPEDKENAGEIMIQSASVATGYIDGENFCQEWYATGDLGFVDEDGYLYITGRKKRLINVAGKKVDPIEVEEVIMRHPEVADVVVKGCKSEIYGEEIEALVVKKNPDLSPEDIIKHCHKYLAPFKAPHVIKWIHEIDKSSTGKKRYAVQEVPDAAE